MQTFELESKDGKVIVEIRVICPVCGEHIDQVLDNHRKNRIKIKCKQCVQRRCSGEDGDEIRLCVRCGKELTQDYKRLYCSTKCSREEHNDRCARAKGNNSTVKRCEECESLFMQKRTSQRFCSKKCSRRFTDRVPAIYRNIKFRCEDPKAVQYKNYGAKGVRCRFTYAEFEKLYFSSAVCCLCKEPFDKNDSRKMKSIDRIDSNGDYHVANCRLVCRSCNSKRIG